MPDQKSQRATADASASTETGVDALNGRIAELEQSQRRLLQQQAMYMQMLDAMHDMILVKDQNSRILYANKSFRDFYGMSLEALQGIIDAPFNQKEWTEQYLVDDARVITSGTKLVIPEEPVTRFDGEVHYFNTIKTPIFDQDGKAEQMVAVCRDITEHKLAEEERKRTEKALDEAERLFRQMAESMRDVFFVAEPAFRKFVYVSPAYERTWGRPCRELLEDPDSIVNAILVQDRPQFLQKLEGAKLSETGELNHEFRIQRDGEVRWIWCRTFAVYNDAGEFVRICGITHDITERKEVERRVSEFNSMVSHELRTPLTSIRAALGLIEGGQTEPVGDSTMDLIQIARAECDRLVRLINDLLDIKKMEADKIELKHERVSAADVVTDVVNSLRGIAQEAQIRLVAGEIEELELVFQGDRDRIIQVLTNLVSNAVKFSPQGSRVVINAEGLTIGGSGRIRFSVSDEGPGIPVEARDKLFTAFHQIDSSDSRAKGGTGLGLAISKGIVEKHGGIIGFESIENGGSTFWFELPAAGKD